MRAQSLDDINRLTQTTLQFSFGKQSAGAKQISTPTIKPNENAATGVKSLESPGEPFIFGEPSDGAAKTSTLAGLSEMNGNMDQRPATLKDVWQILDTNKGIISAVSASAQTVHMRPPINASSTPDGGAIKKRRRGGKKYKEMMARKAEREANRQNNTSVENPIPATPQSQLHSDAQAATNAIKGNVQKNATSSMSWHGVQGPNNAKRGRMAGGTPPEAMQLMKKPNFEKTTHFLQTLISAPLCQHLRRTNMFAV